MESSSQTWPASFIMCVKHGAEVYSSRRLNLPIKCSAISMSPFGSDTKPKEGEGEALHVIASVYFYFLTCKLQMENSARTPPGFTSVERVGPREPEPLYYSSRNSLYLHLLSGKDLECCKESIASQGYPRRGIRGSVAPGS